MLKKVKTVYFEGLIRGSIEIRPKAGPTNKVKSRYCGGRISLK